MKRMSKVWLSMFAIMLALTLSMAGTAGAVLTNSCPVGAPLTTANCGCVADQADTRYTLGEDMICDTRHGIVIGAVGVTIDGAGYKLDGGSVTDRNCEAAVEGMEVTPDVTEYAGFGHPCRCAGGFDTGCEGCNDSGIFNARDNKLGGGCNAAAPMCQGGCDNVTVRNLEITNWCNGIFMSGDCDDNNGRPGSQGHDEYRLTGLLVEGNSIHDCGGGDCGIATPGVMIASWEHRYFNNGIFLAEVGIDAAGPSSEQGPVYPECKECVIDDTECPDLVQSGEGCAPQSVNRNIIRHNRIYNQTGCGIGSCPGGNGISLSGGLEIQGVLTWTGCNEIAKNVIKHCAFSGIQYTHATVYNRMHGNICTGNLLGGITTPVCWSCYQYIYDNVAKDNDGSGIGTMATAKIKNNICTDNREIPEDSQLRNLGMLMPDGTRFWDPAFDGCGIFVGGRYGCGEADSNELIGNTCSGNDGPDIRLQGNSMMVSEAIGDKNKCMTTEGYCDANPFNPAVCEDGQAGPGGVGGCRYMAGARLNCKADLNHDCEVNFWDFMIMRGEWRSDNCCPCQFPVYP